jgi:hypothetical protein
MTVGNVTKIPSGISQIQAYINIMKSGAVNKYLCSNYDKAKNLIMINYFLQSIDLEEILS